MPHSRKGRILEEQVMAYTAQSNAKNENEYEQKDENLATLAPPTMIEITNRDRFLVMSLTIGSGCKRSIGLFKVPRG